MNEVFKIFLSMSFSGALLILALLFGKRLWKDKIGRQWQYYIWLMVILRLLLPFGPETSLMGKVYETVDRAMARSAPAPRQDLSTVPGGMPAPVAGPEAESEDAPAAAAAHPLRDIGALFADQVWLVWLGVALGMLLRKITIYQGFMQYIRAGSTPVADTGVLDRVCVAAEQAGVKKPVELWVNPLLSSPLLTGFLRPCIVLPSAEIPEKDFGYIILHELTHYRRLDMFYKWLVQITLCLHWFNPLVHLMSREITKACEFSCDEAVLAKTGRHGARDYGKTLLDAMAAVGRYKENLGSVTLAENQRLLKERLEAILKSRKPSGTVRILTAALTLCVVLGAAFAGVHTSETAAENIRAASLPGTSEMGRLALSLDLGAAAANVRAAAGALHSPTASHGQDDRDWQGSGREAGDWREAGQDTDDWRNSGRDGSGQGETSGGRIWYPQVIPVNFETMAEGEIVWLGEYTLSEGDRIWYAVSAETGMGLQVGFAKPGDESLNTVYYAVHNLRQEDESLECTASATFRSPAPPGTYALFLRATDGPLGNVHGSVSVGFEADTVRISG